MSSNPSLHNFIWIDPHVSFQRKKNQNFQNWSIYLGGKVPQTDTQIHRPICQTYNTPLLVLGVKKVKFLNTFFSFHNINICYPQFKKFVDTIEENLTAVQSSNQKMLRKLKWILVQEYPYFLICSKRKDKLVDNLSKWQK